MNKNEVRIAFEILLEEVETVVNNLNEDGAASFQKGDYEKARRLVENAAQLTEFREKVRGLQKEWQSVFAGKAPMRRKKARRRKFTRKLPRGLRTEEDAFREPILETLVELRGSAAMNDVLKRVRRKMRGILNKYDLRGLPSEPSQIRWRNTAQWCRNAMVREGLLKNTSRRGVWEITERGRRELTRKQVMGEIR